ncbi:threonine/serine exporter family protein [Nocardia heshunensis]
MPGRIGPVPAPATVPGSVAADRQWTLELAGLLSEFGAELLRAGKRTASVEVDLSEVAACYGMRARSFIVPTGLFVRVDQHSSEADGELDFALVNGPDLRLDQAQALESLMARLRTEPLPFDKVRTALAEMRSMPQSVRPVTSVLGYVVATLGLGLMLHPTVAAMPGYAVLGLAVGLLRVLIARYWPALGPILPVAAGVLATAVAQRFAGPLLHEAPQNLFIPPLIAFLPGAALVQGSIELSLGYTLSGVSRLAGAANTLLLLAVGILVGVQAVPAAAAAPPTPHLLGAWVGWIAAVLFLVGFALFYSAPASTLPWLVFALLLERAVQTVGQAVGGIALGAFAAGMLLPPLTAWIQRHHQIPDLLIFLPCFWVLVPGAASLQGVSDLLTHHSTADTVINTVVTLVTISLGILVGARMGSRPRVRLDSSPQRMELHP